MPTFGQRCHELRGGFGYTLQEIANLFGYSKNTPSQWELSDREPAYADLIKLASFYGVTVDYLLGCPSAERDAPFIKTAKTALGQFLRLREGTLLGTSAAARITVVYRFLSETVPTHYSRERVASWLRLSLPAFDRLLSDQSQATDIVAHRFSELSSVPEEWFWMPDPKIFRHQSEAWHSAIEKAKSASMTPQALEELIDQAIAKRARSPR